MKAKAKRIYGTVALIIALAVAVFFWWRAGQRHAIAIASIPTLPSLQDRSAELTQRIRACELSIKDGSGYLPALGELSQLYHANGKYAEASQCYQGLLQIDATNPRWAHRFATILAGYGQLEDAVMLWRWTVSLDGDYTPACIRLADSLLKLNKPSEATEIYQKVLKREPENPYALLGMARFDMDAGRLASARDRLETAVAKSDYAIGYDLLVTVCEQLGDTARAQAIRSKSKAAGSFFDIPDPWLREMYFDCYDSYQLSVVGGVAAREGDRSSGLILVERAVSLEPNNGYYRIQVANMYQQAGNMAKARQHLEKAVTVAPDCSDAWQTLVSLLVTQGQLEEADRVLANGLANCPNSAGLHFKRGQRLSAAGRYDEAIPEFKQAVAVLNDDALPSYELASIYFKLDRNTEAVAALQNALTAEADYPPALSALAFYFIVSGDEPNARKAMLKVKDQARILPEDRTRLEQAYQKQFGHRP